MKTILTLLLAGLLSFALSAQVKTPAPSPSSKVEQQVGLTDVTIEYSRPGVKDRTVFGDLVPYGKKWRTGANKNTMITFSTDATFGGQAVEAGSYAVFTMPGEKEWAVYLYKDTENWGVPEEWKEDMVAATATVKPVMMSNSTETMSISMENITDSGATFDLVWDKCKVSVPVGVGTDAMVIESIEATMAGPSGNDYYNAARYYRENGKDLTQALTWMDKAVEMRGEKFWMLRHKSLLHADMGDTKKAIEVATRSMELAKEAGNDGYVKMNAASISEWGGK